MIIKINNKYLKFLILTFLIILLAGCGNKGNIGINTVGTVSPTEIPKNNNTESISETEEIRVLEGDNEKQISYLFYNEANNSKNITLSFHANYTKEEVAKIELLQGDALLPIKVKVQSKTINNNGQFAISILEYVQKFDKIRFYDKNENILFTLHVGQYYFEKVNIPTNLEEEKRWMLDKYQTNNKINMYKIEANFVKKTSDPSQFEILVPKDLVNLNILKQTNTKTEKGTTLQFLYNSEIALSSFKNYTAIGYDMLVVQKDPSDKKNVMADLFIPFENK